MWKLFTTEYKRTQTPNKPLTFSPPPPPKKKKDGKGKEAEKKEVKHIVTIPYTHQKTRKAIKHLNAPVMQTFLFVPRNPYFSLLTRSRSSCLLISSFSPRLS